LCFFTKTFFRLASFFRKLYSNLQRGINEKKNSFSTERNLPFVCFHQLLLAFVLRLLSSKLAHSQFSVVKEDNDLIDIIEDWHSTSFKVPCNVVFVVLKKFKYVST